ncbi:MAG TPA: hypothetical protein VGH20_00045 [Myxococcales bacterium]
MLVAPNAERLIAEALKLRVEERSDLVDRLLRSLDEEESGDLDAEDRARLNAALDLSDQQFNAGQTVPAEEVIDRLRKRKP